MMTDSMKRLAWFLAYRLEDLDDKNIPVSANIRLAGAVKKYLELHPIRLFGLNSMKE